jgi:hypothetical protein
MLFKLPNGVEMHAQNDIDILSLYEEIFVQKSYLQHGITVSDHDCIFDVGANTGVFSVYLGRLYKGLKIFAFEPFPQTFAFLRKNAALHLSATATKLFNAGLSDHRGTARFECDKFMSPTATMYPKEIAGCVRSGTRMKDWVRAGMTDLPRVSKWPQKRADRILKLSQIPLVGSVVTFGVFLLFAAVLARKQLFMQRADCELLTVSDVIRDQNCESIDLMKIDVEGSELDVVNGIEDGDWRKIRQLVIEVHDMEGRVEKMKNILEQRGYTTTVAQLDFETLKLLKNYTIYAVRA